MKKMQKEFRNIRQPGHNCDTSLLDRKWMSADLSVPDRVVLVEAELNFTITMLQLSTHPGFTKTRKQPLDFLARAWKDLQGCVSAPRVAPSHQPSGELSQWLQNLQEAMEKALSLPHENAGCLEDYAVRHVFEVLEDLKCAALQEECS
ncbi:interferon lambda-3-like [Neopelma chrysocephalum]|uniref:interferon lambda-3-like n=1 Tax=Neopelma chrysocephalum TaxID=114329 RepID=UPI000FCD3A09|nr:interferon lambda-3-like [Neopelma chrysocephalum]